MEIRLSDHFTFSKLIRFVLPSIVMMIFTSIYGIVDGLFVSNFVGKVAFASLNLMMPFIMILSAFGFMFGAGGSAIIAKTLGEQNNERANEIFSLLILTIFLGGCLISVSGNVLMPQIATLLHATEQMKPLSILYGRMMMISLPFFMLQSSFQSLFVTAEKPKLGLRVTIFAGCMNMVMDFLLVGCLRWGLIGAALATNCCEILGGSIPVIYFMRKNDSLLKLGRPCNEYRLLIKAATNGSSEFMSNISGSIVGMIYNYQLLRFAKENGVAAYGAIMYVNFIFIAIFLGYATGSAPLTGYNYGAQNHRELKNLFKKSIQILTILGCSIFLISYICSRPIMNLFVGYDKELLEFTLHGFHIYGWHYLLCGFNIYSSSFFTALNNGKVSAFISFLRTLLLQGGCLLVLPAILGVDGIWGAVVLADVVASFITLYCFYHYKDQYHYL